MRLRRLARALIAVGGVLLFLGWTGVGAAGRTGLQQTDPLVWTMVAISIAGAALTFGLMIYALLKFRDRATRGRRYG